MLKPLYDRSCPNCDEGRLFEQHKWFGVSTVSAVLECDHCGHSESRIDIGQYARKAISRHQLWADMHYITGRKDGTWYATYGSPKLPDSQADVDDRAQRIANAIEAEERNIKTIFTYSTGYQMTPDEYCDWLKIPRITSDDN